MFWSVCKSHAKVNVHRLFALIVFFCFTFKNKGFIQIHTPIITSSDCEGAGDLFHVLVSRRTRCLLPLSAKFLCSLLASWTVESQDLKVHSFELQPTSQYRDSSMRKPLLGMGILCPCIICYGIVYQWYVESLYIWSNFPS